MKLYIDIGNSDIVLGFRENNEWYQIHRISSKEATAFIEGSIEMVTRKFAQLRFSEIEFITISSVVPRLTTTVKMILKKFFPAYQNKQFLLVNAKVYDDLNVTITTNKSEIGTDLVANAVAAFDYAKSACIVVDFGTALTFTIIDNDGNIQGVNIAPGIKTALKALVGNTAQLSEIPLELPDTIIGKNTVHAIQSGILWGYVDLVKGMLGRIKNELNQNCVIIGTGGLADVLKPLNSTFDYIDVQLTLNGLVLIQKITC